jgi:hypothetical protein
MGRTFWAMTGILGALVPEGIDADLKVFDVNIPLLL